MFSFISFSINWNFIGITLELLVWFYWYVICVSDYIMGRGLGISFIRLSYLHFLCSCLSRVFVGERAVAHGPIKFPTLVEGDTKAPFSIAIAPRWGEGATLFPWLIHSTLDPYLIMPSVKQGGIKYHFLNLWYGLTWDWTPISRTQVNTLGQWPGPIKC